MTFVFFSSPQVSFVLSQTVPGVRVVSLGGGEPGNGARVGRAGTQKQTRGHLNNPPPSLHANPTSERTNPERKRFKREVGLGSA